MFMTACLLLSLGCREGTKEVAPTSLQDRTHKIDSLFNAQYPQDLFHGGVVITHEGETIYEDYSGIADRSWNLPIEKDTKFDVASVNKSMIAALVLKAVEEGKLRLDDKLVDLLSDFSYQGSFHPEITLHHMLCHSSGLPDYDGIPEQMQRNDFSLFKRMRFTNEAYVDFISKLELVNQPAQKFYYSNFAYHLLAILLEEIYQRPFAELLKEKLTRPLGLENTVSVSKNEIVIPNLAKAYQFQERTGEWQENQFIDLSLGRRIFSTASDLNRWAQVMDNPGWLSAASLKLMKQNHLTGIDKTFSYGYGWVVIDENNKSDMADLGIQQPYIIHGGSTEGYKAMLVNINNGTYVISFLSNAGNRTHEVQLAKEIANILVK